MNTDAKARLQSMAGTISVAVQILKAELPTMQAYLKECSDMESIGPILAPSLYLNSERQAANAVMEPVIRAAVRFITDYDTQMARAQAALAKVSR